MEKLSIFWVASTAYKNLDHCLGFLLSWTFIYMKNNEQQYSLLFSWLFCSQGFSSFNNVSGSPKPQDLKWEESWTTLMLQLCALSFLPCLIIITLNVATVLFPVPERGQKMAWPRAFFGEVSGLLKIIPPLQQFLLSPQ